MLAVERFELRLVDRLERGLGLARPRVRMTTEQRLAELAVGEELRRRLVLRDALQPLIPEDVDLVGGQRRTDRDVGDEIDQSRREFGEPAGDERRVVLRNGRGQRAAHAEDVAPDFSARTGLRALLDHIRRQLRKSGEIRRIARIAGQDRQGDRNLRDRGLARDDDAQAVRQRTLDARRELERTLGPDRRPLVLRQHVARRGQHEADCAEHSA